MQTPVYLSPESSTVNSHPHLQRSIVTTHGDYPYYAGHVPAAPHGCGAPRYATTILSVRKKGQVVVIGDGQVSQGSAIVKPNAKKVRRLGTDGSILAGFAGGTADAFTLIERLERKLEEYPGQLTRASVDLAKAWRTDKYLRRLQATLLVSDRDVSLEITGHGDVLEYSDGLIAIGSGGQFALAAARALIRQDDLSALEVAEQSMQIASEMCVYTNDNFIVETLDCEGEDSEGGDRTTAGSADEKEEK